MSKTSIKEVPGKLVLKLKKVNWKDLAIKVGFAIWNFVKRIGLALWDAIKHLPYFCRVVIHPFDGFFRLKNDPRRRSIPAAVIIYIILVFSAIMNKQMIGYIFADVQAQLNLNIVIEIISALLPYMLWVVANWCFTSLMDGGGKLSDIFCATAVAVIPIIVCNIILIPISHFISYESESMYNFIASVGQVFTYLLMFVGMMITHQYTVRKAIATTILTIVGMAIIGFVIVLIMYLIQQLVGFISSLSTEISFRLNE